MDLVFHPKNLRRKISHLKLNSALPKNPSSQNNNFVCKKITLSFILWIRIFLNWGVVGGGGVKGLGKGEGWESPVSTHCSNL